MPICDLTALVEKHVLKKHDEKKGGRIAISDIALVEELPAQVHQSIKAYVGCIGGAIRGTSLLILENI